MTVRRNLISSAEHSGAILMGFDGPTHEDNGHTSVAVEISRDQRPYYTITSADGGSVELSGPEAYKIAEEILRDRARHSSRIPVLKPIAALIQMPDMSLYVE